MCTSCVSGLFDQAVVLARHRLRFLVWWLACMFSLAILNYPSLNDPLVKHMWVSTITEVVDAGDPQLNGADNSHVKERRMPSAIIAGAGKCGTDALVTYLNTSRSFVIDSAYHSFDELNFFNDNYGKGLHWYISNMPLSDSDQFVIEKAAPYMWNPVVPARVYQTNPGMLLIFVLCDPVKRAISLYTHINSYKLVDGRDPLPPFTDLVYIDQSTGKLTEQELKSRPQAFLKCGKYVNFIRQWLQYFPLSQMVFISGEDLILSPLNEVVKVTSFLGRPGAVTEENLYFDANRGYFCFKSFTNDRWCMDPKSKGRKHPTVPKDLLSALQDHYRPYNEELYNLIGKDFGWPKYFGGKYPA